MWHGLATTYYAHYFRRRHVYTRRRVALLSQVNSLFSQSRGAPGRRSILGMLCKDGVTIDWAFSAKPVVDLVIKALDIAYEQRS